MWVRNDVFVLVVGVDVCIGLVVICIGVIGWVVLFLVVFFIGWL